MTDETEEVRPLILFGIIAACFANEYFSVLSILG